MPRLGLPLEFISVQLAFARRMADLSGSSLTDALIDCTILRTLLNVRVTKETAQDCAPWQAFLAGLGRATDPESWAYAYYVEREKDEPAIDPTDGFGCFWYSYKHFEL